MIVVTNIYAPNRKTKEMVSSFERHGYEVAVNTAKFPYGNIFKELVKCYERAATGHETFVYSDGGDTYCQRSFDIPNDRLIWSTEKHCFPHPEIAEQYPNPRVKTQWKYLNNGNYGGSLELMLEFVNRYGLRDMPNNATCQHETMLAFLKAKKDKFPIYLDYKCEYFQTIAFDSPDPKSPTPQDECYPTHVVNGKPKYTGTDFKIVDGLVVNKMTKKTPAILHGNGTTPMEWIYELNNG